MHNEDYKTLQENMERLKEEVMSRVRFVRKLRAFLASPASSAALVMVLLLCANIFISFGDVVSNIMNHGDWGGRFSYTYSSIMQARMVVQAFALLTSVSLLILSVKILFKLKMPVSMLGNFITSRSRLMFFRS